MNVKTSQSIDWYQTILLPATICLTASFAFAPDALGDDAVRDRPDTQAGDQVRDSWPRLLGATFDGVLPNNERVDWSAKPKLASALAVADGYGIGSIDAEGNYFHFDSPNGDSERLRCIDLESGKTKWSQSQPLQYRDLYGYETGPRSSATIAGDQVFTMGVGGQLNCRSKADGKLIWGVDANSRYGVVTNFFGAGGSPLVLDDVVIVMVGGSPKEDQRIAPGRLDRVSPDDSAIVAFNRIDGKEAWKCGADLASYSSPRTAQIDGETMVLLYARDYLLAIDPKPGSKGTSQGGTVRWKYEHGAEVLESVNAMVPIVDGNRVFISECYELGSVLLHASKQSAEVIWRDPPGNRRKQSMRVHWSNPVLIDGNLYGCSGRNAPDSDFRCIEFATGKVNWTDSRRTRSSVTAVGDYLLVLEERGLFQVIRANAEKIDVIAEWDFSDSPDWPTIAYPCWAAPVVVGNRVLIRGDQKVLCLEFPQR